MAKSKKGKQRAQPQNVEDEPLDTIEEVAHEEGGQWQVEETNPDAWNQEPWGPDENAVPGGWEAQHPVSPTLPEAQPPLPAWSQPAPAADPWPTAPPSAPVTGGGGGEGGGGGGEAWGAPPSAAPLPPAKVPSRRSSRRQAQAARAPGALGHGASHFTSWQNWAAEVAGATPKPAVASGGGGWRDWNQPKLAPQPPVESRWGASAGVGYDPRSGAGQDVGLGAHGQSWNAPAEQTHWPSHNQGQMNGGGGGWDAPQAGGWDSHGNGDDWNRQQADVWDTQNDGGWDNYGKGDESGWNDPNGNDAAWDNHGGGGGDTWDTPDTGKDGWQGWSEPQQPDKSTHNPLAPRMRRGSSASHPSSRTMAFATNRMSAAPPVPLQASISNSSRGIELYESGGFSLGGGEILESLQMPLFGSDRLARDRLLWLFPREKDPRVGFILRWLKSVEHGLAAFALDVFLDDEERGALVINAATFSTQNPIFDRLTHEDAIETRDKRLQESIGFYDPIKHAIIFVFLPSRSGNSAAVWRQKVQVPDISRHRYHRIVREIPSAAWKKQVFVDEILPETPPKKKRKGVFKRFFRMFRIFKVDW